MQIKHFKMQPLSEETSHLYPSTKVPTMLRSDVVRRATKLEYAQARLLFLELGSKTTSEMEPSNSQLLLSDTFRMLVCSYLPGAILFQKISL